MPRLAHSHLLRKPANRLDTAMFAGPITFDFRSATHGEFSLTALADNLRRVLNIVKLPKLIAAVPA